MKIMVLGDTHGNISAVRSAISACVDKDIRTIIQVGDFGLWDHTLSGVSFLDWTERALAEAGITMIALPGNHENFDHWNWYLDHLPKSQISPQMVYLRQHLLITDKVAKFVLHDKTFAIAGGAVSIDRSSRVEGETWWRDEQLPEADASYYPYADVDYLFTHDCSDKTNWGFTLVPDQQSQIHRRRIDTVLSIAKPIVHFHGHMHANYQWWNPTGVRAGDEEITWTLTYGLECDGMQWSRAIIDTEADTVEWCPL